MAQILESSFFLSDQELESQQTKEGHLGNRLPVVAFYAITYALVYV